MKTEILYTTRKPKPQPTPAPAEAPAPAPNRITIGWGEQGRLHLNRSKAPETHRQQKPKREAGGSNRVRSAVSAESRPIPLAEPRIQVKTVERYSRLERVRGKQLLDELLNQRSEKQPLLEYLTILYSRSTQRYWIADAETGEIFLRQSFTMLEHCYEAAIEMEHTFDMLEVIALRPPETIERIDAIVLAHAWREQVKPKLARGVA